MTTLSPLLSLFYSTANGGPTWTFDYYMQQVMMSNCTLFFPIIIALIAGYIITREYTDDTMKNILTIPIPYKPVSYTHLNALYAKKEQKKNAAICKDYNAS